MSRRLSTSVFCTLLVSAACIPVQAQAKAVSSADRAALRSLDLITTKFLAASGKAGRAAKSRQVGYHNWFNNSTTGRGCLDQMYYIYQDGGDSPEQLKASVSQAYQMAKYVYVSQPLWQPYQNFNRQLAAIRPRKISRELQTNLSILKSRTATTARRLKDLSQAFAINTTPHAAFCDAFMKWSKPWHWDSKPYALYASDLINQVVSSIRKTNATRSLSGMARSLRQSKGHRAAASFIQYGGLGVSFEPLNSDNNLNAIATGTLDVLANQAAIDTLRQAKNLLAGYLATYHSLPGTTHALAQTMNALQVGSSTIWLAADDAHHAGSAGSGTGKTVYAYQSIAGATGGAVICVSSAGSKNYCTAILGGVDSQPTYTISGPSTAVPLAAYGTLSAGSGIPLPSYTAPAGWQAGLIS